MVFCIIFAMVASNSYQAMVEGSKDIRDLVNSTYTTTDFIMNNLPLLVFIVDIFSLIALFAKKGGQEV
jgi:hypothetical protein